MLPSLKHPYHRVLVRLVICAATLLGSVATAQAASVYFRDRVQARSIKQHFVQVGLSDAWLKVRGDGDTDLDCWVYDASNQLVDSDTDDTDYCILQTPGYGRHRLVIKNYGAVYNEYVVSQE
jgi:hypothetical protein